MSFYLRFAATSDVGRVRRDNQDSGYVGPSLIVVADGVGGAARGDIASSATVETLSKLDAPAGDDPLSVLSATIHLAHDRLAEFVEAHPDLDGTSTTVSAAIFDGTQLHVGHVGDSRGYLLRDGVLQQLTSDHSLVQSLVDEGRITEAEARVHPHRNLILKAIDSVHEPEPDLFSVDLQAGDRILFCSDGCSGVLENETMAGLLAGEPLESVSAALVHSALEAGSSDNVTVVVAVVVDGEAASPVSPVVVGAAAANPHLHIPDESTGNLTETDVDQLQEASIDPEAIRYAPLPPPRRVWVRRLVMLTVLVLLVAGGGFAAYQWSQTRYFVIADSNDVVTINKGVNFDLPLIDLHSEISAHGYTEGNVTVPAPTYTLADFENDVAGKLRDGVDRDSQKAAVMYLHDGYCAHHPPQPGDDLAKLGLVPRSARAVLIFGYAYVPNPAAPSATLTWTTDDVLVFSCLRIN